MGIEAGNWVFTGASAYKSLSRSPRSQWVGLEDGSTQVVRQTRTACATRQRSAWRLACRHAAPAWGMQSGGHGSRASLTRRYTFMPAPPVSRKGAARTM